MGNISFDIYDMLLELMGYPHQGKDGVGSLASENLEEVLMLAKELGISIANAPMDLFLWNDDVHDMMEVVLALYEICKLGNEDAMRVMMEAHEQGKALIRTGEKDELVGMMDLLGEQGIQASLHVAKAGAS